ncbi:AI-2E family transporter [Myxacorys almedinensis]|uniref:AI-2E family transporter n=1 Tax=Myxacorys almedinensis TaxID=2651157 RepID=UPI0023679666|nr:AI-2E family transporter [Myxacorys almedinensis]
MKFGQWLGLIAVIASLYIIWQICRLLLLLFTAIVLATALNLLVQQLQRLGLKRGWAVLLTLFSLILALVGISWLIIPPFLDQFSHLIALFPTGLEQIEQAINWLENRVLDPYFPNIPDANGLLRQIQPFATNLLGQGVALFTTSVNAALELALVLILALMLLINPQAYRQAFIRFFCLLSITN